MYKYILEKAGDLDWMAILPLLIFTIVFTIITIRALSYKKEFVTRMGNLPLEDDSISENENEI